MSNLVLIYLDAKKNGTQIFMFVQHFLLGLSPWAVEQVTSSSSSRLALSSSPLTACNLYFYATFEKKIWAILNITSKQNQAVVLCRECGRSISSSLLFVVGGGMNPKVLGVVFRCFMRRKVIIKVQKWR